ncbi:MAG: hypothetical protein LC775_07535, partial [Acidobacteria bacterium]|nr:hypothetical protein [Acidobacteriota bacterium]
LERYELDVFAEEDQILEQRIRLAEEAKAASVAVGAAVGMISPGEAAASGDALSEVTKRAGRRKLAAQTSLFDLANQKIVDDIRNLDTDHLSPEEAKELLRKLRERLL